MTGLLKDLMHDRADQAGRPNVDIDAIVATGDKRVRRRRVVTGAGVLAAAAAVVAAVAVVPGAVDKAGPDPVQPQPRQDFSAARPTYAVGSTIHYGNQTVDVSPLDPSVLTKTNQGFVFLADDGHVYFTDGASAPEDLGQTSGINIVSDGSYAAFTVAGSDRNEVVVYNTADGTSVRTTTGSPPGSQDTNDPKKDVSVLAMDGSRLYWRNEQGIVVSDTSSLTDDPIVLAPGAFSDWLLDVSDGVLARKSFDDVSITVSRETDATGPNFPGWFGILSPGASYLVSWTDRWTESFDLFDVATGEDVTPTTPDLRKTLLVSWLDENTFVMAGANSRKASADLYRCQAASGDCQRIVTDVGAFEDITGLYRG